MRGAWVRKTVYVGMVLTVCAVIPGQVVAQSENAIDIIDIEPSRIVLGDLITVSGVVYFTNNSSWVENAEIEVTGTHMGNWFGKTDEYGRFSIDMQAPLLVIEDLPLTVTAYDPLTNSTVSEGLAIDVLPPLQPEEPDPPGPKVPWTAALVGLFICIAIVIYVAMQERQR